MTRKYPLEILGRLRWTMDFLVILKHIHCYNFIRYVITGYESLFHNLLDQKTKMSKHNNNKNSIIYIRFVRDFLNAYFIHYTYYRSSCFIV